MIFSCDGCKTQYTLGDDKIPSGGIRVRCPKCRFVWRLAPSQKESVFEISSSSFVSDSAVMENNSGASSWNAGPASASAVADQPQMDTPQQEIEISDTIQEPVVDQVVVETPEQKKKQERAKRLARVFVSDILVYNREKRDQAMADGTLMTVLGPEIKKAWEAYKEKIGSDIVESNEYFRSALNEILAEGQKIF